MAVASRDPASSVTRESAWTAVLLAFWFVATTACIAQTVDRTGLAGRPWFGFWDAIVLSTSEPFVVKFVQPLRGGASHAAGIRNDDRADLREQDITTRAYVTWQLTAMKPTSVRLHRGDKSFEARVTGSTLWDGKYRRRLTQFLGTAPAICFLACALLIIVRRSRTLEGRALALFLICLVIGEMTAPSKFTVPDGRAYVLLSFISSLSSFAAMLILIRLSSKFGERSAWRYAIEWLAYIASAIFLGESAAGCIGLWTLRFDPLPFLLGGFWRAFPLIPTAMFAIAAVTAVASSAPAARPRAGWLLLPLPLALALSLLWAETVGAPTWGEVLALSVIAGALSLASAILVTYAVLKRRVLDVGFVLSRSLTVAILSLIVVAAFVLLEWALGAFVANASHATGVVANAGLALILGLSMRFLHRRVDNFVDAAMFRKRHENTRALSEFSKEAAFVTEREALLGLAIDKLRKHTDARSAGLFVRENGCYQAVRSFNDVPAIVSENDPAILALKTWHKPLDPHRYDTALKGDLTLPIVARGQLLGFLLCGERLGSEIYAPDEIDALEQFAQGVGSAFDAFAHDTQGPERDGAVLEELRRLRHILEAQSKGRGRS